MATRFYLYVALFLIVTPYAYLRGGSTERRGATIWALTYLCSLIAIRLPIPSWNDIPPVLLFVDVLSACAFVQLTRRDNQFWVRWAMALQIFTVATHAAVLIEPEIKRWAYRIFIYGPGWGILVLLAVGTRAAALARQRAVSRY